MGHKYTRGMRLLGQVLFSPPLFALSTPKLGQTPPPTPPAQHYCRSRSVVLLPATAPQPRVGPGKTSCPLRQGNGGREGARSRGWQGWSPSYPGNVLD